MKLRQHIIAQRANECVQQRHQMGENNKEYGALVHKLPTLIQHNGLCQTTGFLLAKAADKNVFQQVLNDFSTIFHCVETTLPAEDDKLHEAFIKADVYQTMHYTRTALTVSEWLCRSVQGIFDEDEAPDPTQDTL